MAWITFRIPADSWWSSVVGVTCLLQWHSVVSAACPCYRSLGVSLPPACPFQLCPRCLSSANPSASALICPHPIPPSCSPFNRFHFFNSIRINTEGYTSLVYQWVRCPWSFKKSIFSSSFLIPTMISSLIQRLSRGVLNQNEYLNNRNDRGKVRDPFICWHWPGLSQEARVGPPSGHPIWGVVLNFPLAPRSWMKSRGYDLSWHSTTEWQLHCVTTVPLKFLTALTKAFVSHGCFK